ncbi:MAG: tryptophan tryptophylquinone biosynthesis enzyme MauG [Verrucomicrobia bacterium]|nr:tryptophan tryptophylquinone biosynthesis enzyme MauG [Verrucomicrobiota bacterium]
MKPCPQSSLTRLITDASALLVALTCAHTALNAAPPQPEYHRDTAKGAFKRPTSVPHPKDNPPTPDRISLGKALFFDPRLSRANNISCGSCHNPSFAWGDGLPKGVGHGSKEVGRRTPTILNTAWAETLFWDGRASSLEEQALGPIAAPGEMNMPLDQVLAKLKSVPGYLPLFEKAYPGEGISEQTIAKAIAAFERTVISGTAPFDEWIAGKENAISDTAKRGFDLFNTKANCVKCHSGWNFTDDGFHDIGLADADIGRGAHLKELESMQHAFKTPTLRNVVQRAPYARRIGTKPQGGRAVLQPRRRREATQSFARDCSVEPDRRRSRRAHSVHGNPHEHRSARRTADPSDRFSRPRFP